MPDISQDNPAWELAVSESAIAYAPMVHVHDGRSLLAQRDRLESYFTRIGGILPLSLHPRWLSIVQQGLDHVPYCLEVRENEKTRGILALAFVRSLFFGRFLVSMPYLNYGGPLADSDSTARLLIDRAIELARDLRVRYLELRHEDEIAHPRLSQTRSDKVHMRLDLPGAAESLWGGLHAKVRNQVRKAQKANLTVAWGGRDMLGDFYGIFCRNMRDLGTPVFSKRLFAAILEQFPESAEICLVRLQNKAIAAGLLLHGRSVAEVPSASSLRRYNSTCANMLLYWSLLERAVERGHDVFDFGRSSLDSPTYRFKKQWGAMPFAAHWQYCVREGSIQDARRDNPRFERFIRMWQRLPVWVTRLLGPHIVRGIP